MLPGIRSKPLLKEVAVNTVYLSYYKCLSVQSKPYNLPMSRMNSYKLPLMPTWLTVLRQEGINSSWHILTAHPRTWNRGDQGLQLKEEHGKSVFLIPHTGFNFRDLGIVG